MTLMKTGLVLATLAFASPALAQSGSMPMGMQHGGMQHGGMMHHGEMGMGGESPAAPEFMQSMDHMNQDMMAAKDPNPNREFAKKMMAHHQGAIAMSEIILRHTNDPKVRMIANKTIRENRKGIEELRSYLARH